MLVDPLQLQWITHSCDRIQPVDRKKIVERRIGISNLGDFIFIAF